MQENFQRAYAFARKEEGGNDDDPRDPGGRTSRGVIQRVYNGFRDRKHLPHKDVWQASEAEVEEIYRTQYWQPYGDLLPSGLDLAFFDFCLNAGRQQAVKELQRCVGVPVDGMIGQQTLAAVEAHSDLGSLIHDYCERRRAFYRKLRTFKTFGRGWLARTGRCERAAAELANTVVYPTGDAAHSARANPDDTAKPPVSIENGMAAGTGSTVAYGLADQLQQATSHLQAFSDSIAIVKYLLAGVAVIGFGLTVYALWHKRKVAE